MNIAKRQGLALLTLLLAFAQNARAAYAAEPIAKRPVLIGGLTLSWGPTPHMAGLVEGLKKLGYREDQDFVLGVRFTRGDFGALPGAAAELTRAGTDILLVTIEPELEAARQATHTVPIVFVGAMDDPVKGGFVKSFAKPGGNVTGISVFFIPLSGKRLELLVRIAPHAKRILFPYYEGDPFSREQVRLYEESAKVLGVTVLARPVRGAAELQAALRDLARGRVDAALSPSYYHLDIAGQLLEAGRRQRIPVMFDTDWYVEQGALVAYGPSFYKAGVRLARVVHKIIQGADPGSIPVEVMSDIEFTINLKTARAMGLDIPREVLYQADRIIR